MTKAASRTAKRKTAKAQGTLRSSNEEEDSDYFNEGDDDEEIPLPLLAKKTSRTVKRSVSKLDDDDGDYQESNQEEDPEEINVTSFDSDSGDVHEAEKEVAAPPKRSKAKPRPRVTNTKKDSQPAESRRTRLARNATASATVKSVWRLP